MVLWMRTLLGQFGRHKSLARRKYREFVMERVDGEHEKKYYEVKDQRYLEEESFIDRIEGQKREVENAVYDVSIEVIAWKVSKVTGITQESVYFDSAGEEKIPYYDCLTL